MSVLLITLPPRRKLSAQGGDLPAVTPPAEWRYVLSENGSTVTRSGLAAPGLLPKADQVVAVVPAAEVSWHRIVLPKAPAARLRPALAGVLEDALLDDTEATHFAVPARASGGQTQWVAALHQGWLAAMLAALEGAGLGVDRVVPAFAPLEGGPLHGHFHADAEAAAGAEAGSPWLVLAGPAGVTHWRLGGGLTPATVGALVGTPQLADAAIRWTASPAAAAAAEKWLGHSVTVRSDAETAIDSLASDWNLRQFDLAPRMRGTRQVKALLRQLAGRDWRWARWGLAALVAVNVIGINAWAWQQSRALDERRQAMNTLLQTTFPGVRSVLDAPLQMQRETERLRTAAGRPGEGDLETLIAAAAAHWPDGLPPVQALSYDGASLTLVAPGFDAAQLPALRDALRPIGLEATFAEGRVTLARRAGPRP